jgi:short subunit dehydrogenase-like uncharacterized protein
MGKKPVIVYGASGYTGRLIAECLRDRGIGFTAAGRNAERVKEAMLAVPGIETANYDVAAADATVEDLTALFKGAKVVCNVCGPFITHGPTVVEAALNAGVHYIDTTGEQASILNVARDWGPRFADKGLVAAPSTAYMYAPNEIAAHLALETRGVDSLDAVVMFSGFPTYTSTQSIYVQLKAQAYYLEDNELRPYAKGRGFEVHLPSRHETHMALPWGGTGLPVWLEHDPRVRNVRVLAGVMDRGLMEGVLAMERDFEANVRGLPDNEQAAMLAERAAMVQNTMPPRENPVQHRTIDSVMGRGSLATSHVVLFGTCAYKQTGVLQAAAAQHLLHNAPKAVGFASPCTAFGHQELLAALESYGLTAVRRYA